MSSEIVVDRSYITTLERYMIKHMPIPTPFSPDPVIYVKSIAHDMDNDGVWRAYVTFSDGHHTTYRVAQSEYGLRADWEWHAVDNRTSEGTIPDAQRDAVNAALDAADAGDFTAIDAIMRQAGITDIQDATLTRRDITYYRMPSSQWIRKSERDG